MREIAPVVEQIAPVIGQAPVQPIARTHGPAWIAPVATSQALYQEWSRIRIGRTKAGRDKVAPASPVRAIVPATALALTAQVIAPATVPESIAQASPVRVDPVVPAESDDLAVREDQVALEVSAALAALVVPEITDAPVARETMDGQADRETVPTSTTPTGIAGITV